MTNSAQHSSWTLNLSSCLAAALVLAIGLALVAATQPAHAQTLTLLHSFSNGLDGSYPQAGLTMDRAGNLYGTTGSGGLPNHCVSFGCGTVFKLIYKNSGWLLYTIYSFQGGTDGDGPTARLVFGPDGALYGTTLYGGQGNCNGDGPNCGIVFRLQPPAGVCHAFQCPWTETILFRFEGGVYGGIPEGDIIFDPAGNIYGTTAAGGYTGGNCGSFGCGVVYELSQSNGHWNETVLYTFYGGADGQRPDGGVIRDAAGNLYGTTAEGGGSSNCGSGCGTVFELSPSQGGWTNNTLYAFQGFNDGAFPYAGLTLDAAGNLYGSTSSYGSGSGGTVFELTPSGGSWAFSTIYELTGRFLGGPQGALTLDGTGNLLGAAQYDGANNVGSVFKLAPMNGSWVYTDIHDFMPQGDGGWLFDGLVLDSKGNIYGTAFHGGIHGYGNVFEITP